jgi:phage gpG-like protein
MNNNSNLDAFVKKLNNIIQKVDYAPFLNNVRQAIDTSIQRNFQVGGRYGNDNQFGGGSQKWKVSKGATKRQGQTLRKSGMLSASIRVNVTQQNGRIIAVVGSNKKYAAHQHFGSIPGGFMHPGGTPYVPIFKCSGKGAKRTCKVVGTRFIKKSKVATLKEKVKDNLKYTKPHKIYIPPRPYLVLQNEDIKLISDMLRRFIASKF